MTALPNIQPEIGDEGFSQPVCYYQTIVIDTQQQNLTTLDHRLADFLVPSDCFSLYDLTKNLQDYVDGANVQDGTLTLQILHTSATLIVNELDEPMLLMDILRKLRQLAPKEEQYLHNSPLRIANRCESDTHCDRNGDAHVKSALFGSPSVTLIIKDGQLLVGEWQKIALLEFDGPRRREIIAQIMGLSK